MCIVLIQLFSLLLLLDTVWQGADQAFAFASGMAALAAVLRLVGAGGGVVAGDDLYGGTSRLLAQVAPTLGINVTNVDTTNIRYAPIMPICRGSADCLDWFQPMPAAVKR